MGGAGGDGVGVRGKHVRARENEIIGFDAMCFSAILHPTHGPHETSNSPLNRTDAAISTFRAQGAWSVEDIVHQHL